MPRGSQFVGRTRYALDFLPLLDRLEVAADDRIRDLLAALELRGRVLGYRGGGSDGIHGWLTPEETTELAMRLGELLLPAYPAILDGMAGYRRRLPQGGTRYAANDVGTDELMLSFVRTVATVAVGDGHGVLWGNDVIPALWRHQP